MSGYSGLRPYRIRVSLALLGGLLFGSGCDSSPSGSDETGSTNDGEESGSDYGVDSTDSSDESGSDSGDLGCPERQEVVAEFSISAIPYDNRSVDISSECVVLGQGGHETFWQFMLDCGSMNLSLTLEAEPGLPFADGLQGPVRLEYREVGDEKWVALRSKTDSLSYFGVEASSLTPPGENQQEWFAPAKIEVMTSPCPVTKNGCSNAMRMSVSVDEEESPVFDGSWLPGAYVEEAVSCEDGSEQWLDFLVSVRS